MGGRSRGGLRDCGRSVAVASVQTAASHLPQQHKKAAHRLLALHDLFVCICGRMGRGYAAGTGVSAKSSESASAFAASAASRAFFRKVD